jgi:hypothetical protein
MMGPPATRDYLPWSKLAAAGYRPAMTGESSKIPGPDRMAFLHHG